VDLGVGVVPIINLEWIQKIFRDNLERGYSAEATVDIRVVDAETGQVLLADSGTASVELKLNVLVLAGNIGLLSFFALTGKTILLAFAALALALNLFANRGLLLAYARAEGLGFALMEEIKHQLSMCPEVVLVGETGNGIDAVKTIKELKPDLLFLDIEMPGMKGLEIMDSLSSIPSYRPFVIIITAYDNYALKAFEYDVVDYLLKPIDTKRFSTAMSRVLRYFGSSPRIKRITAKRGNRILLIPVDEISYIGVEDTVVCIYSKGNVYSTTYRTLDDVEKELDAKVFFRTHRGYIVNLKKVREIKQEDSGSLLLKIEDVKDIDIPVSRSKAKDMKSIFKL